MKEKITDKPLSVIEKAIGIDTVNIKIEKYKFINPENTKLMICHAPTDKDNIPLYNNVLWHDENQKPVMGSKATYNSEKYNFNLTLTARRNNEKPRIEISFETAKIFTGNNYKTKNVKELMEALNLIKSEVKEKCGISFNLEDVMLSKLHIQMTIEFKGSIAIMFDALKYVDVILSMIIFYSHSQSLRWDSKSNSYKKLNIYNKNIKMNETHHSSWEGLTEGYIDAMRIEYKLESKKAISEDLKIKYVTELTQDKINKIFIKILKEVISLAMPKSCYSVNGTIKDKYNAYLKDNDKSGLNDYMYFESVICMIKENHGINEIKEFVELFGKSDRNNRRTMKKIKKIITEYDIAKNVKKKTNFFDNLYDSIFGGKGRISQKNQTLLCC